VYVEDNPFDQMEWEMIHNSVSETHQELGIEKSSPAQARGIELPSLGL